MTSSNLPHSDIPGQITVHFCSRCGRRRNSAVDWCCYEPRGPQTQQAVPLTACEYIYLGLTADDDG